VERFVLPSKPCSKSDFDEHWFQRWRPSMKPFSANGIRLGNGFLHRKEWEFVVVSQALEERGMLAPGKRGIGFAVGTEPLPALFANSGCDILATDNFDDSQGAWRDQWAPNKQALQRPEFCPADIFEQHVELRRVDMRSIPADLRGYDFSWSCCAFEHLSSLKSGFDFIVAQMDCLKPGGWAVHTTEFNLASNDHTIETGPTVVYRKRDIELLAWGLEELGHHVEPLDLTIGNAPEDRFIAVKPWDDMTKNIAHLRLRIGPFVCTSLLLIAGKGMAGAA